MVEKSPVEEFLGLIKKGFDDSTFVKLTLGKPVKKSADLRNIYIKPAIIKEIQILSFVFHYQRKDITQNFSINEALKKIKEHLTAAFRQANFIDQHFEKQLVINKKGNAAITGSKHEVPVLRELSHDKIKLRLVDPKGKIYLQKLGITNHAFEINPKMSAKFRQINKFVEIIESILPDEMPDTPFKVLDMGAGKGYLTFALFDHLYNTKQFGVQMAGVELRADLVDKCNKIALDSSFEKLRFEKNSIDDFNVENVNMLIALHACDTATDDAIFKGTINGELNININDQPKGVYFVRLSNTTNTFVKKVVIE